MLGAKGYVKLWISVDEHGRLSWRVSPGMPDQQWHRDGGFPVTAPGESDYRFGQINCGYFLDELTPELGVSGCWTDTSNVVMDH